MTRLLAQVNVGRLRAPWDDPVVQGFVGALDAVNRLADISPGFVWRLRAASGHPVAPPPYDDPRLFVNVSIWRSYDEMHAFAYRSSHGAFVRRRTLWFEPVQQPSTAMWWLAEDARPDASEAMARLEYLRAHGPSPQAFSLLRRFDAGGQPVNRRRRDLPR